MILVHITWEDSHARSGWTTEAQPAEPYVIRSVGWIVRESETAITLASNVETGETQWACEMTIPKRAITARREIDGEVLIGQHPIADLPGPATIPA